MKGLLIRIALIVSVLMVQAILYEIKLPFDTVMPASSWHAAELKFGAPHIMIQFMFAAVSIIQIVEIFGYCNKEFNWNIN